MPLEVRHYITDAGTDPFAEWFDGRSTLNRRKGIGVTTRKGPSRRRASARASVPHRPHLLAWLKDPENAAVYVEAAIEEGDPAGLMQALRNVAEAQGGVSRIAARTGLSRETLYRTLSKRGNPQLKSLAAILDATGLRLAVKPIDMRTVR